MALPFTSVIWHPLTNLLPVIATGTKPVLYPEAGVRAVIIVGVGLLTVKASGRVTFEPSVFLMVTLYRSRSEVRSGEACT